MSVQFSHPHYLLLLPLVWFFTWWVVRHSLADLAKARRDMSAVVRGLLLTLLVLALAGLQLVRPTSTLCTVFVLDKSDSIDTSSQHNELDRALAYLREAVKTKRHGDRFALVVFGADAVLEHAPEDTTGIGRIVSIPGTARTDIAAGIQLAMASFPQESGKQIVLFSDGNENLGNTLDQAGLASSNNVRISVVPLTRDINRGEALLLHADVPGEVKEGAPFQVSVVAEALQETDGTITLYRNTDAVETRRVHLKPGKTVVAFEQSVTTGGLYHYRATLDVPASHDTLPDNNIAYAYTRIAGKPKVLVVEGVPGDGAQLARALRANDLQVEIGGPERIPATLAVCAQYDSLIFANVPAWRMSPVQMNIIRSAVRDTGMGFAMVGGEESFGAGGYYKTPIEEALPVSMEIKKQKVLPSMTLVIVIDISGSMTMEEDGVPKIRLAADAACAAVDLLQPMDEVCVIGFDTRPVYVVPLTSARDKSHIIAQIERLEARGGGIMALPAHTEAYKVARSARTQAKHVIMCADASDTEFNAMEARECMALSRQMRQEKISMSVVGFGSPGDPHVPFHRDWAANAGGNSYLAERMSNLPQIFTRDVMTMSKSLLVEEPFTARVADATHAASQAIPWESAPPLRGYVATSMKDTPSARELLVTQKDDPLLAAWTYGIGRSLAFTSDATAHWGVHWVNSWPAFPAFWSQASRWTLRPGGTANFNTTIVTEHGRATVVVEAVTSDGEFRNMLDLSAHISHVSGTNAIGGPQATQETLQLEQTAPGRYEASFEARDTGTYVVTVEERDGHTVKGLQMSTLAVPYSPEYQNVRPNLTLLNEIAERAKGKVNPQPAEIFGKLRFGSRTLQDLWPVLLTLLAVLFLFDVAVRRVLLPWDEIFSAVQKAVRKYLPARRAAAPAGVPQHRTATLGSLLETKEKVQTRTDGDDGTTATLRTLRNQARSDAAIPPVVHVPPVQKTPPDTPTPSTSTASSLLQKKRERSQKE